MSQISFSGSSQPGNLQRQMMDAVRAFESGDEYAAEKHCREILRYSSDYRILHLLGMILWNRGDAIEALEYLESAQKACPDSPSILYSLAVIYRHAGEYRRTMDLCQKALSLQPHFPDACCTLAEVHLTLGDFENAAAFFQKALVQQPGHFQAQVGLNQIQPTIEHIRSVAASWKRERNIHSESSSSLKSRFYFPHLLNALQLHGNGVEIGVQEGIFSEHLLTHWQGQKLISIDPWREFPKQSYDDVANVNQAEHDRLYKSTLKRLLLFKERSVVWRLTSSEAAELVSDETLDFCYLDGDHSYSGLQNDIQAWYSKVRRGGIICGHDYIQDGQHEIGNFGVQRAVNEFVQSNQLLLHVSAEPQTLFPSWFVMKP